MFNRQLSRHLYILSLSATAFFMPLSVWLLTFFIIVLLIVWISDGGVKRLAELKNRQWVIPVFFGTYLVYLLWMVTTSDIPFGLRELKMKLPLLIFPLVMGLSDPLNKKEMKTVLSFFIAGVVLSSVIGLIWYTFDRNIEDIANPRKISLFITHIRLALMTNLSIVISGWYFMTDSPKKSRLIYLASALWLTLFLFLLLSVTGIIIFGILFIIVVSHIARRSCKFLIKTGLILLMAGLFILTLLYVSSQVRAFYKDGEAYSYPLKTHTLNGNPYLHYPERKDIENGNLVWIYINEKELRNEWDSRSRISYDSTDIKGQILRFTLIRYLTSAGLTKDSAGVAALSQNEIKFIENGVTNRLFTERKPLRSRIYEIIWQIDYYSKGGNPSGHSVTQRFEYLTKGWNVFRENFITGTGTGDIKGKFLEQFIKEKSALAHEFIYMPHNQYLTFLISFGLAGFILISCSILIPVIIRKSYRSFLFNMFFLILLVSMFGEDTLETHTGVSFFAYFYSLFVFGIKGSELIYNDEKQGFSDKSH